MTQTCGQVPKNALKRQSSTTPLKRCTLIPIKPSPCFMKSFVVTVLKKDKKWYEVAVLVIQEKCLYNLHFAQNRLSL